MGEADQSMHQRELSGVVEFNATEITKAERLIDEYFIVKSRRPRDIEKTHKASDAFLFDDLRLYVTLRDNLALRPSDLASIVFEVQIKTFLQHAWAIATHDLLYKTDDANWSKERIAYQIKAMLEQAEISTQETERLAASAALAKEDWRTTAIKKGIALVKSQWSHDELPEDVRRLAGNITTLMDALSLEVDGLEEVLNQGKAQRNGVHPANLSPYAMVVQYLLNAEKDKMVSFLKRDKSRTRILIPEEVEFPRVSTGRNLKT